MEHLLKKEGRPNKANEIDIILYVNSWDTLAEIYESAQDVMSCNKLEICLVEPTYNQNSYYEARSLNINYIEAKEFPATSIVQGNYAVLALLSEYTGECPRCWNKTSNKNTSNHPDLCSRCLPIVLVYEDKYGPLPLKKI